MASVISTIPTSDVTLPSFVVNRRHLNGKFEKAWLRCPDNRGESLQWRLFLPVSYAMTALQLEAFNDGVAIPTGNSNVLDTTGRYRTYERQVQLFYERYTTDRSKAKTPYVTRIWQGQVWYLYRLAPAATPGLSNHGFGLADDIAEDSDSNNSTPVTAIDSSTLAWMRDHAPLHGWGLDAHNEPWHWHWYMPKNPNTLTQRTVDVLAGAGIEVPDLSAFGFTVPKPTSAPTPQPPPSGGTYTVVAGDSWWKISQKLGVSMDALIAANPPATSSTVIHPGDVLNVPGSSGTPPPTPTPPGTDWATQGAQMPTPPGDPMLKIGTVHDNVPWLQAVLSSMYTTEQPVTNIYNPAWVDADSIPPGQATDNLFGNATKQSLAYWQSKNGLTADGVYGPQTAERMKSVRHK